MLTCSSDYSAKPVSCPRLHTDFPSSSSLSRPGALKGLYCLLRNRTETLPTQACITHVVCASPKLTPNLVPESFGICPADQKARSLWVREWFTPCSRLLVQRDTLLGVPRNEICFILLKTRDPGNHPLFDGAYPLEWYILIELNLCCISFQLWDASSLTA